MALNHLGSVRRRLASCAFGIMLLPGIAQAQARMGVDWQSQFERARQLADAGSLRDAESIFDHGTQSIAADSLTRAYAYFGRAFVSQQRFLTGDTVGSPVIIASVLADYSRAGALDARGIGIAAHNNAGTFLRALGRSQEASGEFLAAALAGPHPDRATFFLNAGVEFAARNTPSGSDTAGWAFGQALRLAPSRSDVLRVYSSWLARTVPVPALLDSLSGWRTDTLRAEIAANAISSVLLRSGPEISDGDAARALVAFAEALPIMQISPATFDAKYRGRLDRAAALHTSIGDGVRVLIEAMAPRPDGRSFRPDGAQWWESRRESGRQAWSSVLRWMGDWYFQQNRQALAQTFYEAALGGSSSLNSTWVDRRALVPLAMIYVDRDDRQANAKLQYDVRQFTEILFSAKGNAYERGDVEQIRDFHLTLGTIYAAKGKWTGSGPDNAEYQIEHLRQASEALRKQTGRPETVPPELLTKLAVHYKQNGKNLQADSVKGEIRTQYRLRGKPGEGEAVIRRIDADALKPDALKPVLRISTTRGQSQAGVVPQPQNQASKPPVLVARRDSVAPPASKPTTTVTAIQNAKTADAAAKAPPDSGTKQPVTGQRIPARTDSISKVPDTTSSTLFQISGRVQNAHGAILPGVDVQIVIQGKPTTVRTGLRGTFKLAIPRNVDEIFVRVVHLNERFTGKMAPASQLEIKLAPIQKN
jgi:tetratricopeptide (TPR) repeat protein